MLGEAGSGCRLIAAVGRFTTARSLKTVSLQVFAKKLMQEKAEQQAAAADGKKVA